jgi:hypothetical protein
VSSLSKKASWSIWIALFLAYLYMAVVVMGGASESIAKIADNPSCAVPLDLKFFGVSKEEAEQTLSCFGSKGRELYVTFASREDVLYPITYGVFFGFTLFALSSFCIKRKGIILTISAIPIIITFSDFVENYYILNLLREFPALTPGSVCCMSLFNSVKWGLFFTLVLPSTVIFSIWSLKILLTRKTSDPAGE